MFAMQPASVPIAVQTAFYLAGVVPVFVRGLNREAWLSDQAKVDEREVLLIDADVTPDRLVAIADQALEAGAMRHLPTG